MTKISIGGAGGPGLKELGVPPPVEVSLDKVRDPFAAVARAVGRNVVLDLGPGSPPSRRVMPAGEDTPPSESPGA